MSLKSETDEIYDDLKKEKREKNPEKAKKKTVILFIVICSVLFVFMGLASFIPSYIFSNKALDNVYEFMGDKAYDKITVIKLDEYKLKNVSVKTDNESGDTFFIWIEDVKSIEYFTENNFKGEYALIKENFTDNDYREKTHTKEKYKPRRCEAYYHVYTSPSNTTNESFGVYFYKQKDGGYSVRITGNVYK